MAPWSYDDGCHDDVEWHDSHVRENPAAACDGAAVAAKSDAWHELQADPIPLKTFDTWQEAHTTARWAPVRGNDVNEWSNRPPHVGLETE